jgi:hypothetical protein
MAVLNLALAAEALEAGVVDVLRTATVAEWDPTAVFVAEVLCTLAFDATVFDLACFADALVLDGTGAAWPIAMRSRRPAKTEIPRQKKVTVFQLIFRTISANLQ